MKNYINNISIREKQAYAALCLVQHCKNTKVIDNKEN